MKNQILFLLLIGSGFISAMEEEEPAVSNIKLHASPNAIRRGSMITRGETENTHDDVSSNAEGQMNVAEEINYAANTINSLIVATREGNTTSEKILQHMGALLKVEKKRLKVEQDQLKLLREGYIFYKAATVCSLKEDLGEVSPKSPTSRIQNSLGAWFTIQQVNEQLNSQSRQEMETMVHQQKRHKKHDNQVSISARQPVTSKSEKSSKKEKKGRHKKDKTGKSSKEAKHHHND